MNLKNLLDGKPRYCIEAHVIYTGVYGIADALSKIHEFKFSDGDLSISEIGYHHDLRPANILIDHNGVFLIADFGLSKLKPDNQDSKTRLKGGHDDYLPPESFDYEEWINGSVGRAADVWALACMLAELATFVGGLDVVMFREQRKHKFVRGGISKTDHAFDLDGKLCRAVSKWLDSLCAQAKDPNVVALVGVVRDMMNTDHIERPKITALLPRLKLLAINSVYDAVDHLFDKTTSRDIDGVCEGDTRIFLFLEHKRVQAWWWDFCQRRYPGDFANDGDIILSSLKGLRSHMESLEPPGSNMVLDGFLGNPLPPGLLKEIDALCTSLPGDLSNEIQSRWSQAVCEIDDMAILQAIRAASKPERYRSVGAAVSMR
jgi:serine/threonine protein kinase